MPQATIRMLSIASLAVTLTAGAQTAFADDVPDIFKMPSGNISCHYTPPGELPSQGAGLFCERAEPSPVRVLMGAHDHPATERKFQDATCCDAPYVLDYGAVWKADPFTCLSAQDGLTCRRPDGHGFFLSRSTARTY